jgi:hypothetical protein
MANFKDHKRLALQIGVIGTTLFAGTMLLYMEISNYYIFTINLFVLLVIGSSGGIAPDIDSKDSIPNRYLFSFLSNITAMVAIYIVHFETSILETLVTLSGNIDLPFLHNNIVLETLAISSIILTRPIIKIVLQYTFATFTRHRGVFHSIPMGMLLGLFIALLAPVNLIFFFAGILFTVNYYGHLLYDEYYSIGQREEVQSNGRTKMVRYLKSSAGTGFTLFGTKKRGDPLYYVAIYIAIFALGSMQIDLATSVATLFASNI